MPVVFSDRSQADLVDILEFHVLRDARYARSLTDRLVAAGQSLANFPERGVMIERAGRATGQRRIFEHDHAIVYEISDGGVIILRILHGARDIDAILSEDS